MPFVLSRLLARLAALRTWLTPAAVIVVVFGTSWPLMALFEPAGSGLVRPENYWWYFVVTAATVGYGDFAPETGAGHVVGGYVIIGGIVALTTLFTKMVTAVEQARGRRMRGSGEVDSTDHVVLLGYTPGRTERMVQQLLADGASTLVLCAWEEVVTHPMPDLPVTFVRGDLAARDVLYRAGVERAKTVLIDVRDDNEALAVAVTVDHVSVRSHVVVTLRDLERAPLLRYVDENIRCVQWHSPRMVTEELSSPGISEMYAELMTQGGANTYSVTLPEAFGSVRFGFCQATLGDRHGVILLAARVGGVLTVNPGRDVELPPGAVLYYVGERRLMPEQLEQALRP
ncbi:ion channel [Amycolatopsis sp. H20-H5]|uniref:ion channel n=1 Tax=Amycolatopsis sp. H20-H5 TaxID=3046309 RepID=UPI002DB5A77D|nr:ion channel [Amycolatopsis sp. H20-H5]MEC3975831.1 ion channel [Amycolatopsis sp. H20-H5]